MKRYRLALSALSILVSICLISAFAPLASAQFIGCDNAGNLFSVNTSAGTAALIGPLPTNMTECVSNPSNGKFYAQAADGAFTLYSINPLTGASLGSVSTGAALNGMEFVNGTLYATAIANASDPSNLVTVNPDTGALTIIGATGFGPISGLAYDAATGTMYGVTGGGSEANLITINLSTGAGTMVGATGLNRIGSIRFSGGILYGGLTNNASTDANYLVQIDTSTGAATPVGNTSFSITGLAVDTRYSNAIPTMTEWGMISLLALLAIGGCYYIGRLRPAF